MKELRIFQSLIFALGFLLTNLDASSQQEAMHSQYIFNKQMFNPGYTGYREGFNATFLHRSQWVGFKGAPMTQYVTMDSPLKSINELAVGGTMMFDKIGPTSELSLAGDIAFRLRLSNRSTLSFGGKASLSLYQANLTDLELISDFEGTNDEFFNYNPKSVLLPNVGFGIFYYSKNYFLGVSIPKMIQNKLEKKETAIYEALEGSTRPTAYLTGGYLFKINRELKFQPSFLFRATSGAPLSVNINAQLHYLKILTFGAFYSFNEVAGLVFQWQFHKQWKLGYSVDLATSKLITTNVGSHELMINYSVAKRRKRIVYPRYF